MIVKLTAEMVKATGATDSSDFLAKLNAIMQENSTLKEHMSDTTNFDALSKRIDALESKIVGEAKISEIVSAAVKTGVADLDTRIEQSASATASKITAQALASVGTTPVKPSPAPAAATLADQITSLEAAGKHEEAFALLTPAERSEFFGNAKAYSAFRRAQMSGHARIR